MGTIPFSNPAGNNQMSPPTKVGMGGIGPVSKIPGTGMGNIPGAPNAGANPYSPTDPALHGHAMAAPALHGHDPNVQIEKSLGYNPAATSGDQGFITNASSYSSGQNDLQKQLIDIYGKGVGGSLFALLNSMSGTNSTILQEYIASLQPQMATAQANVNASLGAGGVSANSSVAAIADANLQAQEFAAISGESAKLTQSQEELTAQLLSGMSGAASKEVATSAWSTFAEVMNNITGDIGNIVSGSNFKTSAGQGAGQMAPPMDNATARGQLPSFSPAQGDPTNYNDPYWAGLGAGW